MPAHFSSDGGSASGDDAASHSLGGHASAVVQEYTPSDNELEEEEERVRRNNAEVIITEHAYMDGSETDDALESPTHLDHSGRVMVNQYVLGDALGKGKHGVVRACYAENDPTDKLAMKIVMRDPPEAKIARKYKGFKNPRLPRSNSTPVVDQIHTVESKIRREIAIMKKCRHPHVVRLFEVIDDRQLNSIYMIMEYLGGGEIQWREKISYDPPAYKPLLKVDQARRILRDAMLGLEYLHLQGIIHRDIKPANLVWARNRSHVKIADFGVAHFSYAQRLAHAGPDITDEDPILIDDAELSKLAGSPPFIAPEVLPELAKGYVLDSERSPPQVTKAIDIWALGITLFGFLFGHLPFEGMAEFVIYASIVNDDWMPHARMGYDGIPSGGRHPANDGSEGSMAIHLLERCLDKNGKTRITLDEMKVDPWFLIGVPNSQQWLQATSRTPIVVTPKEAEEALSIIRVRPKAHIFRRFLGILIPSDTSRRRNRSRDGHKSSSTREHSLTRVFSRKEKGKQRATDTDELSSPPRSAGPSSRGSLRYPSRHDSAATLSPQLSPIARPTLLKEIVKHITPWKPRRTQSAATSVGYEGDADDESAVTTPSRERPGLDFFYASASATSLKPSLTTRPGEPIHRIAVTTRMSAEMLKANAFTHARRTSSWGDNPKEVLESTSGSESLDLLVQAPSRIPLRRAPPSSKAARLDDYYGGMTFKNPTSSDDEGSDSDTFESAAGSQERDVQPAASAHSPSPIPPASGSDSESDGEDAGLVFATRSRQVSDIP